MQQPIKETTKLEKTKSIFQNNSLLMPDSQQLTLNTSNNKELLHKKQEWSSEHVKNIQNSILKFCRNINDLQLSDNFFKMNMTKQILFNECVTKISKKIKDDFTQLESFYSDCKKSCIENDYEVEENLKKYFNATNKLSIPNLHPCLENCQRLFFLMHGDYKQYIHKGENLNI